MYKALRIALLSFVFVGSITIGAFAAGEHEGHSGSAGHSTPSSAVTQMPVEMNGHEGHDSVAAVASESAQNHGGHDANKETHSEGPNWPVLYGFAGANLAMITVAALKRYVFRDRNEVN